MKKEILVVGTHEHILKVILRLINANELWQATGCTDATAALELVEEKDFDLVLIGAGLTEEEENLLIKKLKELQPPRPCVKHYGGGSGLLFAEIYGALN
ncbi:hypothetical protein LPB86_20080 [Pedobacter sp. MC2016-14]|uniref:hypothetical protein n=1 Tax=Pedobacter sp. MC2016-14 TaxID=2897327 RepID=UPI001E4B7918|nr:hypothetical protein [Pedobacter sp. MC2016-14]MCD0490549.1 hypothetical protein [Pedobacter sp. MC2016-14]